MLCLCLRLSKKDSRPRLVTEAGWSRQVRPDEFVKASSSRRVCQGEIAKVRSPKAVSASYIPSAILLLSLRFVIINMLVDRRNA